MVGLLQCLLRGSTGLHYVGPGDSSTGRCLLAAGRAKFTKLLKPLQETYVDAFRTLAQEFPAAFCDDEMRSLG